MIGPLIVVGPGASAQGSPCVKAALVGGYNLISTTTLIPDQKWIVVSVRVGSSLSRISTPVQCAPWRLTAPKQSEVCTRLSGFNIGEVTSTD